MVVVRLRPSLNPGIRASVGTRALVPCCLSLTWERHRASHNMVAGFLQHEQERAGKTQVRVFVTAHHLCCILPPRSDALNPVRQGRGWYRRARAPGGRGHWEVF